MSAAVSRRDPIDLSIEAKLQTQLSKSAADHRPFHSLRQVHFSDAHRMRLVAAAEALRAIETITAHLDVSDIGRHCLYQRIDIVADYLDESRQIICRSVGGENGG